MQKIKCTKCNKIMGGSSSTSKDSTSIYIINVLAVKLE